ncbi:50S ribosomal protein L21 [bacterium]|nr:50S ribosomal protein L21 [bacterium]
MYAIAKSGGKQFKIEQNSKVRVPTLKAAVGDTVRLDSILLLSHGDTVAVGAPFVEGAYAEAHVVRHGRAAKIRIIKYKRRKNYRRTIGHRQGYTELLIDAIMEQGAAAAVEEPKEAQSAEVETAEAGEAKPRRSRRKSAEASEGETPAPAE